MKIGIVGHGFVGQAVSNSLRDCDMMIVDPVQEDANCTPEELIEWDPDAVFICVPTPSNSDGSVDGSIVREVLQHLPDQTLKIVKSTITPEWLTAPRVVFNPEFLTQRTANDDFIHPDFLIFGSELRVDNREAYKIFQDHSAVEIPIALFMTDIKSACLVKYTLNCHYAAKVTFMNEMAELHKTMGCQSTWRQFSEMLSADSRLGYSHLDVPGPDGYYGYGGACFPKDTKALKAYAGAFDVEMKVLTAAMNKNDQIRDEPA